MGRFLETFSPLRQLFVLVDTKSYRVLGASAGFIAFYGADGLLNQGIEGILPDLYLVVSRQSPDAGSHPVAELYTELVRANGSKIPVRASAEWIAEAEDCAWLIAIRDASQEAQLLSSAREARHKMAAILDNTLDGIITISDKGDICDFNRAAESIFGYTAEEVIGRNVSMLMPQPYRSEHDSYIQNYLSSRIPKIIGKGREVMGLTKSGQSFPFYLAIGSDLYIGERRYFIGLVRDLSRERMIQEQLRQAQKMEAIGTMAGGIAHDFNNILGGIMGYVELMLEEATEGSYFREDLTEMLKACNRAKALVQQILTFSRKDKPKRDIVFLDVLIKESLKLLRASIPTIIEIRSKVVPGMSVEADPTQMHQVIMNLCTNAYHAMRETGGCLEVELDEVKIDEDSNSLRKLVHGRYVRLSVIDNGHGMDTATMARIFEPFFTTKQHGEGTGMGLSVVHGIVINHGGEILVKSDLGVGTRFEVLLPLKPILVSEQLLKEPEVAKGQERIMIIDDDEALLRVLVRIVSSAGYRVSAFSSSTEALAAFTKDSDNFDLVLTDQTMPKFTGTELARRMLALRPKLPIILATGFTELVTPESAKELGISEFMQKPIEMKSVIKKIRELLDRASA